MMVAEIEHIAIYIQSLKWLASKIYNNDPIDEELKSIKK